MARSPKFFIPKQSGGVNVVVDPQGLADLLEQNKSIRDTLFGVANAVAAHAQSTASDAEGGAGGRIDGYASAGFSVVWDARGGKRPRVNVVSNADPATATAAHFHTQKIWGVGHLRAALYAITGR